ncbi:MAG TPA: hypothetical protein VF896_10010 [Anaerolineales bacterium]
MNVREYAGPLGVLAAGVIGVSLLCSVSTMAMSDLNSHVFATIVPLNIVDLAVSNLNTAAALTQQAVTAFVPTPTVGPTNTEAALLTPVPSNTSSVFASATPLGPTRTRRPRATITSTPKPLPTRTNPPPPTATDTPAPTDTPIPPTDTPLPPPTDTPLPPPTDTPEPPTSEPPTPVDTSAAPVQVSFPMEGSLP